MPVQQVIGVPNNASRPHIVITFFPSYASQDIVSIGLFFEPNFFTIWFYADKNGEICIGFERVAIAESEQYLAKYHDKQAIIATVSTERFTLLPSALFDESDASKYLKLNTAYQDDGDVAWDHIPARDMTIIYHDVDAAQSKLDSHLPGLNAKHLAGRLIELLGNTSTKVGQHLFIYGSDNLYYFLVFEHRELRLANAIDSQHADDLIYYSLYCAKQLNMKLPQVYIIGEADQLNALHEGLKKYIPGIRTGIEGHSLGLKNLPPSAAELGRHFVGHTAQLCV